jgi:hypothetical protein
VTASVVKAGFGCGNGCGLETGNGCGSKDFNGSCFETGIDCGFETAAAPKILTTH